MWDLWSQQVISTGLIKTHFFMSNTITNFNIANFIDLHKHTTGYPKQCRLFCVFLVICLPMWCIIVGKVWLRCRHYLNNMSPKWRDWQSTAHSVTTCGIVLTYSVKARLHSVYFTAPYDQHGFLATTCIFVFLIPHIKWRWPLQKIVFFFNVVLGIKVLGALI